MNIRDPKILFGLGTVALFGLLSLTGGDPAPFVFKPLANSPVPNPDAFPPTSGTRLTSHLSDGFLRGVIAMASDYRLKGAAIKAEDILAVLNAESGISPAAKNRSSSCAGMNQICPLGAAKGQPFDPLSGLKAVGFGGSLAQYLALTAEQQLPFVRRFFDNVINGRYALLTGMGRMYLLNFNPGNLGRPEDFHLYDKATGGDAYRFNAASLDPEGKGFIAVSDMDKFVKRSLAGNGPNSTKSTPAFSYWRELRGRLNAVSGGGNV